MLEYFVILYDRIFCQFWIDFITLTEIYTLKN